MPVRPGVSVLSKEQVLLDLKAGGLIFHSIELTDVRVRIHAVAIKQRIHILQERVGYTGDYDSWIASVTPPVTAGHENFPTHLAQESTHQSLSSSAVLDCVACH